MTVISSNVAGCGNKDRHSVRRVAVSLDHHLDSFNGYNYMAVNTNTRSSDEALSKAVCNEAWCEPCVGAQSRATMNFGSVVDSQR